MMDIRKMGRQQTYVRPDEISLKVKIARLFSKLNVHELLSEKIDFSN